MMVFVLLVASALTPDDVARLAIERSDVVKKAELDIELVRIDETSFVLENPEIQLGHRSLNSSTAQVDPFDDTQFGVAWKPPELEDLGVSQVMGSMKADAAKKNIAAVTAQVAAEARTLHAEIMSLRDELSLAKERVALIERVAEVQARRLTEQVGTALEARLTSLDALDAQAEVADLTASLARAERRLARLIMEPLPLSLSPSQAPLCALPYDSVDDAIAAATERSPKLRSLALSEQALAWRTTRGWMRFVPWFDRVQVGTLWNSTTPELRARVDVVIPIFEPLSPEFRLIDVERERLAADRRASLRDVESQVRAAWDRLKGYVDLHAVYVAAHEDIEKSQEVVGSALAAELTDTLRVTAVQQRVLTARRQALRARFRCDEAAIAFAAATGALVAN